MHFHQLLNQQHQSSEGKGNENEIKQNCIAIKCQQKMPFITGTD